MNNLDDKPDYRIYDIEDAWNQAAHENIQRELIDTGINPSEASNKEKGNFGEIVTDVEMAKEGWVRITTDNYGIDSTTNVGNDLYKSYKEQVLNGSIESDSCIRLNDKTHIGIDGVFMRKDNKNGKEEFCIVESKYGKSQLKTNSDGIKQMSHNWIYNENQGRLEKAVGEEMAKVIRLAAENNLVEYRVARIKHDKEGRQSVVFKRINP
jgi:hypothetical protein